MSGFENPADSAPASSSELDEFDEAMTPSERLACELALADYQLIGELKATRIRLGLSEAQLGERLGISADSVQAFEGLQTEPTMATIRRYAHALGVMVHHRVEPFEL